MDHIMVVLTCPNGNIVLDPKIFASLMFMAAYGVRKLEGSIQPEDEQLHLLAMQLRDHVR